MCWETSVWIFNLLSTIFGTTRARGFQIWYLALRHSTNQFALDIRKLWMRVTRFNPYGFLPLSRCSSLIWFPARKTRVAKCNAATRFPANENCPTTPVPRGCSASQPQPRQSVLADGRTDVGDVITIISRMDRFPKKSYPWCTAVALRAPDLRYKYRKL